MTGEVSHVEIGAQKATPSRTFFEQLFGWQFHAQLGGTADDQRVADRNAST